MLVSFQLASKYPDNLVRLFDNLETLASDASCFEVLVKIDSEDDVCQKVVADQAMQRRFKLRALISPRGRGYEDLWFALNQLYQLTDPAAYFVCNINDEVRIVQRHWDVRLRRYKGLFGDHIFRLRTSALKFRNYYDYWECGFAPENYAFYTKRWLDICGDWNPCFGPDSSQQYIAYYLGLANCPSIKQFNRDVPILDIGWQGEGVGRGLTRDQQIHRTATNLRLWMKQVSHPMQQELYRRARLLQAHIVQAECANACRIEIFDDQSSRTVLLRDVETSELLDLLPYKIGQLKLSLRNLRRTLQYFYYAGGGREASNLLPVSILEYLINRHPAFRFAMRTLRRVFTAPFRNLRRVLTALVVKLELRGEGSRLHARVGLRRLRVTIWLARALLWVLYKARSTGRPFVRVGNPYFLVLASRRIAYAMRDRDLRWFQIKDSARHKLAPSRDPWLYVRSSVEPAFQLTEPASTSDAERANSPFGSG